MVGTIKIALGDTPEWPVPVRPVLDDVVGGWMPDLEKALLKCRGSVIGISGNDTLLTASIASTVAAWIGARGRQVTLIDASLETPVIAKALLDDGDEGVVDAVLFGVSTSVVARRTLAANVTLVTAGSRPISTSRVLGADAFRVVLDKLARDGALVLVVLPREDLGRALWFLDSVVAVGRTVEEISSVEDALAHSVRPGLTDIVRLLVSLPCMTPPEERRITIEATRDGVVSSDVTFDETVPSADEHPDVTSGVVTAGKTAEAAASESPGSEGPRRDEKTGDVAVVAVESDAAERSSPDAVTGSDFATKREPAGARVVPETGRRNRWVVPVVAVLVVASLGGAWKCGFFGGRGTVTSENGELSAEMSGSTVESGVAADTAIVTAGSDRDLTGLTLAEGDSPGSPAERETAGSLGEITRADDDETRSGAETDRTSQGLDTYQSRGGEPALDWPPAAVGLYVVFTSSHRRETAAYYEMDAFLESGFPAIVVPVELGESGAWYRVAVDVGFETVGEAVDLLVAVKELGYEGAWIERLRQPTTDVDSGE